MSTLKFYNSNDIIAFTMSHGGAEGSGGIPPEEIAKLVGNQSKDGTQGPGKQDRPLNLLPTASRPGLVSSRFADQVDEPGSPATQGPSVVVKDTKTAAAADLQTPNAPQRRVEPLPPNGANAQLPAESKGNGTGRSVDSFAVFHRIRNTQPQSLAEVPGEQGNKADDTAGGGAGGKVRNNGLAGLPGEDQRSFGGPPTQPRDNTSRTGRPGETIPPAEQQNPPDGKRETNEKVKGKEANEQGAEHDEKEEHSEVTGNASIQNLLFETDRPTIHPSPPQAPNFARRLEEIVKDKKVSRIMPDHPTKADVRRGKINKLGAKVAHHLSTVAKEIGGTFLGAVGGANAVGIATGNEKAVLVGSVGATALVIFDVFKTNLLPALLAPKTVLGIIGTTATTGGIAIATETGSFPLSTSNYIAGAGVVLIGWGGKDIWNKIRHGRLIKKDDANTDKEYLTKLRKGTPGAKGEPGLFDIEIQQRENALRAEKNKFVSLESEHYRLYYEALGDEVREQRLAVMAKQEPHKRGFYEKLSAQWRKEAADRLAKMKPKKKAYMRTFWQSLTDNQRLAFKHANLEEAQEYLKTFWSSLNTSQKEVFAKASRDADFRQTFAKKRQAWMKQAEEELPKIDRLRKKQQRNIAIALGRYQRAIEIQEIVEAGKDPRGRLNYRRRQRERNGQEQNQPV